MVRGGIQGRTRSGDWRRTTGIKSHEEATRFNKQLWRFTEVIAAARGIDAAALRAAAGVDADMIEGEATVLA